MLTKIKAAIAAITARLWALAGNSRTIAAAYAIEAIGILDEAKLLDFSSLIGAERAGRVLAVIGLLTFVLRVVTRGPVDFKAQA